MDAWLTQAAEAIGLEPSALSDADEAEILDLARIAAHESGERKQKEESESGDVIVLDNRRSPLSELAKIC